MSDLDPPISAVRAVVARALDEDLGVLGDITSIATVPENNIGVGTFVPRAEGILAGTLAATEVFAQLDSRVTVRWRCYDGEEIHEGSPIGEVEGPLRALLAGERSALNFLGHCSGVATATRRYVRSTHGRARIRDTRKTLPGLRALQKAAVRAGGGLNHRASLSDAVLIKDNHLTQLGLGPAVERTRLRWPGRPIEVECDTFEQVAEAKRVGADLIMLDNMTPEQVAEAVALIDGSALVEISGGVELVVVGDYLKAGVDFVSVGAITHSARELDIGLDIGLDETSSR